MGTDDSGHTGNGAPGSQSGSHQSGSHQSGSHQSGSHQSGSHQSGSHRHESVGDPLRDLLLALAAQIDTVASWFGTGNAGAPRTAAAGTGPGGTSGGSLSGVDSFVREGFGADAIGEIGSLIREISDLLARLIAALITVLEAVVEALRSVPPENAPPPRHYQPITVQLDVPPSRPGSGSGPGSTDSSRVNPWPRPAPGMPEGEM